MHNDQSATLRAGTTQTPAPHAEQSGQAAQSEQGGAVARSRLARYDGLGFHPVGPGQVSEEFVHVFVHGWQPGFLITERLLAATDGVASVPEWDPRVVDATGRPLIEDYVGLLDALAALGENHAVLWYSWLDDSATEADVFQAHRSRQATQVNGRRLAESLQLAMHGHGGPGRRPAPRVQLIGHSHGSAVAVHAATSMHRPPEQITLLDAPEDSLSRIAGANDLIPLVLPRLKPARDGSGPFVDSYASVFGRPYHGRSGLGSVVDVLLTPPLAVQADPVRAINDSHLYPVQWYARSVRESLTSGGAAVGYGWSPLAGGDTRGLHSWYQAPVPRRPMLLHRHVAEPFDAAASRIARRSASTSTVPLGLRMDLSAEMPRSVVRIDSQRGDTLVEFDLRVRGRLHGHERLRIELDGVPAFVARPSFPVPAAGRYLLLVDGAPGGHVVTARLVGVDGELGDDVRIGVVNLRLMRTTSRVPYFTRTRSATAIFASGAAVGSLATVAAAGVGAVVAKKLGRRITRRR